MKELDISLKELILEEVKGLPTEKVLEFLDMSNFVLSVKSSVRDIIKGDFSDTLCTEILSGLQTQPGVRLDILTDIFEQTPFVHQFQCVKDFNSNKCNDKSVNHLFYHLGPDGDPLEGGTNYACLYCSKKENYSRRNDLSGDTAVLGFKPYQNLNRAKEILDKVNHSNLSNDEVKEFSRLIVELAV